MPIQLKSQFDKVKDNPNFRTISDEEFWEASSEISLLLQEFEESIRIEQAKAMKALSDFFLTT